MTIMLYLMAAIAIAYVIRIGGNYPTGVDTMCHVYKGDVLYHAIRQGNWYPLYDRFWYNGVQMMRYWAPLPVYFLSLPLRSSASTVTLCGRTVIPYFPGMERQPS